MEKWMQIPEIPAYEVSSYGRVKRPGKGRKGSPPGFLKNSRDRNGYAVVNLTLADGTQTKKYVHRLVAEAFIDNPSALPQVAHIDGNGMNASIENLRWSTQSHNEQDKKRHGRYNKVKKGSRTFDAVQVSELRARNAAGESLRSIGSSLNVSHNTVKNAIIHGSA